MFFCCDLFRPSDVLMYQGHESEGNPMRDQAVYLWVWLVGLFGILGIVLAALTRMVKRDTSAYDKKFTWQAYPHLDEDHGGNKDTEPNPP